MKHEKGHYLSNKKALKIANLRRAFTILVQHRNP